MELMDHSFKNKLITFSMSIPVTDTVNLRLLLSIPVIVVKDLTSRIASIHDHTSKKRLISPEFLFPLHNYKFN